MKNNFRQCIAYCRALHGADGSKGEYIIHRVIEVIN